MSSVGRFLKKKEGLRERFCCSSRWMWTSWKFHFQTMVIVQRLGKVRIKKYLKQGLFSFLKNI